MTQQVNTLYSAQLKIRELEAKNRDILNRLVQHEMSSQCLEEIEEYLEDLPDSNPVVRRLKAILEGYR